MVTVLMVGACVSLAGCSSIDPTDPSHFTDVLIRNDTSNSVEIVQCDVSCAVLHDRATVGPHGGLEVSLSNEGIEVGYLVERPNGERLGCIYMDYDGVEQTPEVFVSHVVKCRY